MGCNTKTSKILLASKFILCCTTVLHEWVDHLVQNVIAVLLGIQIVVDDNEICPVVATYLSP